MATLRPSKDLRSNSVNEFSPSSIKSTRPIPTPFLRQPSVVEVLEKKQREGLKNRLKMLHTGGVLPSRKPVSKALPVIVKDPVRRMTLPKNPPRKAAHYRSVLTLAAEPEGDQTTASRLTRRHSVGGLICTYGSKERSSSDSNGLGFKSETLPRSGGLSANKYGSKDADSRHKSDPVDTRIQSKFRSAKDDSHLDRNSSSSSSVGSFQPISKTQSQILTNIAKTNREFKDAKTNGNHRRHDVDDEDVFNLPTTKVVLDENRNIKVHGRVDDRGLKDITDKSDTNRLVVNGHKDVTTKIKLDSDIVVTMKTVPQTNSTRPSSTDAFLMTELRSEGIGGTHPNKDKEQPRSMFSTAGLESSVLVDFDGSFPAIPTHKHDRNDESLLVKSQQQHTLATTAHTAVPDFGHSNQEHTEAYATFGKVEDSKKLEPQRSAPNEERQFDDDAQSKIKVLTVTSGRHDFSDDLKELKRNDDKSKDETDQFWSMFDDSFTSPIKTTTTSNKSHSELIDIEFKKSPDAGLGNYGSPGKDKETSKKDDKLKHDSDALWSTFEDSFADSVQTSSSKSYSEPVEADFQKRWDAGHGKHNFSDDLKELIKSDNTSNAESDSGFLQWSGNDDSLTSTIDTTSSKSRSESIEGKFHDIPDVNHGKNYFSDDLRETNKNDDNGEGKASTLWSSTENSLPGSIQATSRSEPIEVEKKRPDSGLGKHNISDDLKELKKIDDKGKDNLDGPRSGVEHSYTGSIQPTTTTTRPPTTTPPPPTTTPPPPPTTTTSKQSRSELIEVEVQKCPDAGLGFCIEGGKESALGDRPVTVKRVFNAATQRCLKEGDEILTVCGKETSTLTRIEAWKLFKALPDGSVKMTIIRRMD